jgi:hypothetical protein
MNNKRKKKKNEPETSSSPVREDRGRQTTQQTISPPLPT